MASYWNSIAFLLLPQPTKIKSKEVKGDPSHAQLHSGLWSSQSESVTVSGTHSFWETAKGNAVRDSNRGISRDCTTDGKRAHAPNRYMFLSLFLEVVLLCVPIMLSSDIYHSILSHSMRGPIITFHRKCSLRCYYAATASYPLVQVLPVRKRLRPTAWCKCYEQNTQVTWSSTCASLMTFAGVEDGKSNIYWY